MKPRAGQMCDFIERARLLEEVRAGAVPAAATAMGEDHETVCAIRQGKITIEQHILDEDAHGFWQVIVCHLIATQKMIHHA